jgi:hypothetical protein
MSARTCATAFTRRLLYLRKVSLAVPWHSRQNTAGRTDGVGASHFSAGDRAGKPDGAPIADEAQIPGKGPLREFLRLREHAQPIWLKMSIPFRGAFARFRLLSP